jgi:outer membrane immunogenic protein
MKTLDFGCFAFTAMLAASAALCAQAGDLHNGSLKDAPPPKHARISWDGLYAGVHGGLGRGSFVAEDPLLGDFVDADFDHEPQGGVVGIQLGHNARRGRWVFGIEADIAATNIEGDSAVGFDPFPGASVSIIETSELKYLGTLRARIGIDAGPALVFVTAGLAAGRVEATFTNAFSAGGPFPDLSISSSSRDTHVGYTVGGGVEFPIREGVTLKGEYLYVNLGTGAYESLPGSPIAFPYDMDFHLLRFGFNYHF